MTKVSCVRAGIACIPGIGPFVAIANDFIASEAHAGDLREAIGLSREPSPLDSLKINRHAMNVSFATLRGDQGAIDTERSIITASLNKAASVNKTHAPILRTYSVCALVGNVLTVALLVTWLTSRIFPVVNPVPLYCLIGGFSLMAIWWTYQIYAYTQCFKKAEAELSQPPA